MQIKFVCPQCTSTRLVQVEKNVTMKHTVVVIDKTDDCVAVDSDGSPEIIEGETDGYECGGCGEFITFDDEYLFTWLQEHNMVE